MAKVCRTCKIELDIDCFNKDKSTQDGRASQCATCRNRWRKIDRYEHPEKYSMWNKEYKKKNPEACKAARKRYRTKFRANNPEKRRAYRLFEKALSVGKIKRKPCEICGAIKSEGHHMDYSKPLEVKWLCMEHHRQYHKHGGMLYEDKNKTQDVQVG